MGILDSIKKSLGQSLNNTVNNAISNTKASAKSELSKGIREAKSKAEQAISKAVNNKTKKFKFDTLPKTLDEFKALDNCDLTDYFATAALAVLMLNVWAEDKEAGKEILEYLNGPYEVSGQDCQFIESQFMNNQTYIPRSYFKGATPDNNYTPEQPYCIEIIETPNSKVEFDQGYITLYCESGGADSPRNISLRTKKSTGEWFINDFRGLLAGIRKAKELDEWA